jgi:hypothetical protein
MTSILIAANIEKTDTGSRWRVVLAVYYSHHFIMHKTYIFIKHSS